MQEPSMRNRRVADLIHRAVAQLMKTEVSDPRLTKMMITTVDLSPDLKNARIFYTLPDDVNREEVTKVLKKAAGFVRHELSARVELRYTPQVSFRYDESIARAQHLMSLMEDINVNE